ncbi:amidohydrolase family protein [Pseudorhodobacter wandonensis]|uniref:amidohydrolase family protein n=1 Tax=Pseudorhodobacter wandonensis TaxID=1120568 RepID=UPI00067E1CCB|nr:amidohydrolase [Pseudorhodobacter wandonensis]
MEFLDTHQHLIYRDPLRYSWTDDIPALAQRSFTLSNYAALTAGKGIIGTLFMEAGADDADYQAEARFIATLLREPLLGQIASCRPETDAGFDAWLEECEGLGVKGYRRILHVVPDDLSRSETFRRNLRKIGAKGLPFDLCFLARQHDVAAELLRACDDQIFMLDHCGVPDIAGGGFAPWAASLRRLAAFPNLNCKLSGITAYCAAGQGETADLMPWVAHVIDCFGPNRIVWGSDWPVANLGVGLPKWIDQSRALLAALSPDEARAITQHNARRIYGL